MYNVDVSMRTSAVYVILNHPIRATKERENIASNLTKQFVNTAKRYGFINCYVRFLPLGNVPK